MLELKNVHVEVEGTEILHDISLQFEPGKVHIIMGPNGSGKSTLANAIMGHPAYTITKGQILVDGKDVTTCSPTERALAGLFLSFQYPAEISGTSIRKILHTAVKARGKNVSVVEFSKQLKESMKQLGMDSSFANRSLNEGFSGGEKKRAEMLQLLTLQPKYALLDETDSGLDVDAIKTVATTLEQVRQDQQMGLIVITHYAKFLSYLTPDTVSVIVKGKVVAQGGKELADKIEEDGFQQYLN